MANGSQPDNNVAPTSTEGGPPPWATLGFPIHAVAGFLIGVGGSNTLRLAAYAALWALLWSILRVLGRSQSEGHSTGQPPADYPLGFLIGFGIAFVVALSSRWLTLSVI